MLGKREYQLAFRLDHLNRLIGRQFFSLIRMNAAYKCAQTKKQIKEELEKLLNELQITGIRKNLAPTVSGGERRRTEIARALAARPRFILLDEPFAGVDPIAVIEIQRIVHFLKERGIGVLITDHNVRETLGICDHAYIISNGSVLAQGKPEAIVENPQVRNAYLGDNFTM